MNKIAFILRINYQMFVVFVYYWRKGFNLKTSEPLTCDVFVRKSGTMWSLLRVPADVFSLSLHVQNMKRPPALPALTRLSSYLIPETLTRVWSPIKSNSLWLPSLSVIESALVPSASFSKQVLCEPCYSPGKTLCLPALFSNLFHKHWWFEQAGAVLC